MSATYFIFYLWQTFLLKYIITENICSTNLNCTCQNAIKMKCVRIEKIEELLFRDQINAFTTITQLDLSNNSITILRARSFPLTNLTKLNLDKNKIEWIEEDAFLGLIYLKQLILSNNRLKRISKNMFTGLKALETLKLNQNMITTITNDTFDHLKLLSKLNITGNPLMCNCDIWWLRTSTIKLLSPFPRCNTPASLHGRVIEKSHYMKCNWETSDPVYTLRITPDKNQVVFENDSLEIICSIDGLKEEENIEFNISWTYKGRNTELQRHVVERESKFYESTLIINDLNDNHGGEWICNFYVFHNLVQQTSIRLDVITKSTRYCQVTVTQNDKGRYTWPQTIAGHKVDLPCQVIDANNMAGTQTYQWVSHTCSANGTWVEFNTDRCPFTSSKTRILQQFSQMNLTDHSASLIESAKGLRNFTCDNLENITNVIDFHFIVSTLENYIKFVEKETELSEYLIEIVACILKLPKSLMWKAQQQHVACSRLLAALELILKYTSSLEFQNDDMAIGGLTILPDSPADISCICVKHIDHFSLNCSNSNATVTKTPTNMEISVQLSDLRYQQHYEGRTLQLTVAVFKDSRLFPDRNNVNKESSFVISANLIGAKTDKLDETLSILFKNNGNFGTLPSLAWWDADSRTWIKEGCRLSSSSIRNSVLKYSCDRMGYFSLMADTEDDPYFGKNVKSKLLFYFLHPPIYIGTFVTVTCLILASATYCFCSVHIQMSKKMKHSLTNTWLSASLFFLIFSTGIHQTEPEIFCQIIGLAIHYFALATLFWMTVTVKMLYKRVQKSNPSSVSTPSEDIPADASVEKPILGIYLVGWGISCILCGIAAAVNIRGYSSLSSSSPSFSSINGGYCFLSPGPALSTVFIPAGLVLFYLLIMCLLVKCVASSPDSNAQLSVGTQAIDLELLDGGGGGGAGGRISFGPDRCSVRSITTPSSQAEDVEHSPARQLKAFVIFLFLYLAATTSAAICVMRPFGWPNEGKAFSVVYAVVCVLLGAFVIFFHCFARSDVRCAWKRALRNKSLRTPSHVIANSLIVPFACAANNEGGAVGVGVAIANDVAVAGNSGDCGAGALFAQDVANAKIVSLDCEQQQAKNSKFLKHTSNINLVRLHRQHYRQGCATTVAAVDNFYNPHQSIVAQKFFKKQRRKRNTSLPHVRKCRSGGSSPVSAAPPFDKGLVALYGSNVVGSRPPPQDESAACDEFTSETHPLTYDEADITVTGCEEAKTGTESEATFTVPEYAEIRDESMKYNDEEGGVANHERFVVPYPRNAETKEQMCGTSDHDWCSCDAVSDVNSEPTYNYAYIRNGYGSSRSVVSDNSSINGHVYVPLATGDLRSSAHPDNYANSVDRYERNVERGGGESRCRPRAKPRTYADYNYHHYNRLPTVRNNVPVAVYDFQKRAKQNDCTDGRSDAAYVGITEHYPTSNNIHRTPSMATNFSSEEKVESCV